MVSAACGDQCSRCGAAKDEHLSAKGPKAAKACSPAGTSAVERLPVGLLRAGRSQGRGREAAAAPPAGCGAPCAERSAAAPGTASCSPSPHVSLCTFLQQRRLLG